MRSATLSGSGQERGSILLVGRGEPMEAALWLAFDRYGLEVASASVRQAAEAALREVPDLALLVGDAARDGGEAVLRQLNAHPSTSLVPVALLSEDASLDRRLHAFRSGVVAVVTRGASADAIAQRVAALVRELPSRSGEASGELGEATLDELAQLITRELRNGILSVEPRSGDGPAQSLRLVLGAGRPVAEAVQSFVERLRPLIADAQPLRYEFHEEPGGRLRLLDDEEPSVDAGDETVFDQLRVLLMDNDPGRTDVLAQALRSRGAQLAVTDVGPKAFERARALDPDVIVIDASAIEGEGFEVVRQLRRDARLRWAALLVARWDELWPESSMAPDLGNLAARIEPLVQPDRTLREQATEAASFDTRLELTGPARLLRALSRVAGTLRVVARTATATVSVDIADGLLVGAHGIIHDDGRPLESRGALAALLAFGSARVHVERADHPATANVMLPVDEALDAADRESPPVEVTSPTRPPGVTMATSSSPPAPSSPQSPADGDGDTAPPAEQASDADAQPEPGAEAAPPGARSDAQPPGSPPADGHQWEHAETVRPPPGLVYGEELAKRIAAKEPDLATVLGAEPAHGAKPKAASDGQQAPAAHGAVPPPPPPVPPVDGSKRRHPKAKGTIEGVAPPPPPAAGASRQASSVGKAAPPPPPSTDGPAAERAHEPATAQPAAGAGNAAAARDDTAADVAVGDDTEADLVIGGAEGGAATAAADAPGAAAPSTAQAPPAPPAAGTAPLGSIGDERPPKHVAQAEASSTVPGEDDPTRRVETVSEKDAEAMTSSPPPKSARSRAALWAVAALIILGGSAAAILMFVPRLMPSDGDSIAHGGSAQPDHGDGTGQAGAAGPSPGAAAAAADEPSRTPDDREADTVQEQRARPAAAAADDVGSHEPAGSDEVDLDLAQERLGESERAPSASDPEPAQAAAGADEPWQKVDPHQLLSQPAERRDARKSRQLVVQARRHLAADELNEAEPLLRESLWLDNRNPRALAYIGKLYLDRGEADRALPLLENASKWRAKRGHYKLWLGDALAKLGRHEEAQQQWHKALQLGEDEARERLH